MFSPANFDWEHDAKGFFEMYHYPLLFIVTSYYPVVFGLRAYMKNNEAIDLGGSKTKRSINFLFWWEISLAIFSMIGAYNVVPHVIHTFSRSNSLTDAICRISDDHYHGYHAFWIFLFNISKFFEFGDTIFIVLRKKPLVVLQHYHHLCTCLYCWYGTIVIYKYNPTILYVFAGMNLLVHSVMYTWFAACRTGWRSPKILMILVTLIQISQMIAGCIVTGIALSTDPACEWAAGDSLGSRSTILMYGSYFFLFAKLFVDNYCCKRAPKGTKRHDAQKLKSG